MWYLRSILIVSDQNIYDNDSHVKIECENTKLLDNISVRLETDSISRHQFVWPK